MLAWPEGTPRFLRLQVSHVRHIYFLSKLLPIAPNLDTLFQLNPTGFGPSDHLIIPSQTLITTSAIHSSLSIDEKYSFESTMLKILKFPHALQPSVTTSNRSDLGNSKHRPTTSTRTTSHDSKGDVLTLPLLFPSHPSAPPSLSPPLISTAAPPHRSLARSKNAVLHTPCLCPLPRPGTFRGIGPMPPSSCPCHALHTCLVSDFANDGQRGPNFRLQDFECQGGGGSNCTQLSMPIGGRSRGF